MTLLAHPLESPQDEPVYWFLLWESAVEQGDFAQADEAAGQLRRLGIRLSWTNPAKASEAVHVAN